MIFLLYYVLLTITRTLYLFISTVTNEHIDIYIYIIKKFFFLLRVYAIVSYFAELVANIICMVVCMTETEI